jgi:hypothetical protein
VLAAIASRRSAVAGTFFGLSDRDDARHVAKKNKVKNFTLRYDSLRIKEEDQMFGSGWVSVQHKHGCMFMPITATAWCKDCRGNIGWMGEWCLLKNSIWEKAWPGTGQKSSSTKMPMKHFLCIGCIEKRIGRRLTRRDFDMRSKHNRTQSDNPHPMSQRLRNRLGFR